MATSEAHKDELRSFWSPSDSVFIAEVPDLPGCMAHGRSPTEAAAEAEVAIGLWIDSAREFGQLVPAPRSSRAFA